MELITTNNVVESHSIGMVGNITRPGKYEVYRVES